MTPAESLALLFVENEAKNLGCAELPGMINRLQTADQNLKVKGIGTEVELIAIKIVLGICKDALSICDCPPAEPQNP